MRSTGSLPHDTTRRQRARTALDICRATRLSWEQRVARRWCCGREREHIDRARLLRPRVLDWTAHAAVIVRVPSVMLWPVGLAAPAAAQVDARRHRWAERRVLKGDVPGRETPQCRGGAVQQRPVQRRDNHRAGARRRRSSTAPAICRLSPSRPAGRPRRPTASWRWPLARHPVATHATTDSKVRLAPSTTSCSQADGRWRCRGLRSGCQSRPHSYPPPPQPAIARPAGRRVRGRG